MTHDQRHRGAHPEDGEQFAVDQIPRIRLALQDYCWLLSRGYTVVAALKLVGDRFELRQRQRLLLQRSACTTAQGTRRNASRLARGEVSAQTLWVDGFNLLINIESAMSGGYLFVGQDGCVRDMASGHGTYRQVNETAIAIQRIGLTLQSLGVDEVIWLLDQPVSNSGRLRMLLFEVAATHGWTWNVELHQSPDEVLKFASGVIVTTDSVILDCAAKWCPLNEWVITEHLPDVRLVDLRTETTDG